MQVQVVIVHQVFEQSDNETYSASSHLLKCDQKHSVLWLVTDVPYWWLSAVFLHRSICTAAMAPFFVPQSVLRTWDRRQLPTSSWSIVAGNHGRIIVGVPDFQSHHSPGNTVHTSMYDKALRFQPVIPVHVPGVVRFWAVKWPADESVAVSSGHSQLNLRLSWSVEPVTY